MSDAFTAAGAQSEPSSYAPLTMDRYITGLVTNRSALRDADVPYLQAKYYGASRFDSIWDGLNVEISARSTLVRRPGLSPYNTQNFPAINRFYDFDFVVDGVDQVRVMADTAGAVYDATGPSTKLNIWNKAAGAGKTCFCSVGNTLYFSNLVENKKWLQASKAWAPGKTFQPGDWIVDPNNNIQLYPAQNVSGIASITIQNNVLTVALEGPDDFATGSNVTLAGLSTATFLNGVTVQPNSNQLPNAFQAPYTHANYALAADTGTATTGGGAAASGSTVPGWSATTGALTNDGAIQWVCWGSSVQNWQPAAPTVAPSVTQVSLPAVSYPVWTASTIYNANLSILDSNGNVQQLTASGTTGSAQPSWSTSYGATTTDGTATWTNAGSGTRTASQIIGAGKIIAVSITTYYTITIPTGNGTGTTTKQVAVTQTYFYSSNAAGTTGTLATSAIAWTAGTGTTVQDGTVTWTNIGLAQTWAALIGANENVSVATQILDSNGYLQNITTSGKSGTTAPTWATIQGGTTQDSSVLWTRGAAYSAAADYSQFWGFSYKCSIDSSESTCSPPSISLQLAGNSLAALQGACSVDTSVDTIVIYRTTQNGSILEYLDEIPQPRGTSTWTYNDTSPDAELVLELQAARANVNDPPPIGIQALAYHMGRVWAAIGNVVQWCSGPDAPVGNGLNAWSPSNTQTFPASVTRLVPVTITDGALLIFTIKDLLGIFGSGTSTDPFYATSYANGVGLLNHDALDVIGSTIHLFTTARKQISLDPSAGYTETGFPIGNQFKKVTTGGISTALYNPATTFVTWHESETDDTALYVSDGSVGWFRYCPVSSPETGFLWSPRAAVQGGTSAVQSIETSAGLRQLLVGPPASGGPILTRDYGTNADNGTAYANTYAVIGSIQLCQPYEICEVAGIVLDSLRIGTAPTIGVLYGEINPTAKVPWDMYQRTSHDPPNLPPSATLFNDRFSTMQDAKPTTCRHLQLLIQWSTENAASELITHTIYGAKHAERKIQ